MIPLPVYPEKPEGKLLEIIKEAKSLVQTDIKVIPSKAVIGSPGRILAIGDKPDWMCEYAYVKEPNVKSIKEAIEWILGITEDPRGVTLIKRMREIFGPEVEDVTAQYVDQGAKQ